MIESNSDEKEINESIDNVACDSTNSGVHTSSFKIPEISTCDPPKEDELEKGYDSEVEVGPFGLNA